MPQVAELRDTSGCDPTRTPFKSTCAHPQHPQDQRSVSFDEWIASALLPRRTRNVPSRLDNLSANSLVLRCLRRRKRVSTRTADIQMVPTHALWSSCVKLFISTSSIRHWGHTRVHSACREEREFVQMRPTSIQNQRQNIHETGGCGPRSRTYRCDGNPVRAWLSRQCAERIQLAECAALRASERWQSAEWAVVKKDAADREYR